MLIQGVRDLLFVERSPGVPDDAVRDILLFTMFMFNLFNSRSNTSIQEEGLGSEWRAFFTFQYMDKGVMGRGVRFFDFYHYLCHQ